VVDTTFQYKKDLNWGLRLCQSTTDNYRSDYLCGNKVALMGNKLVPIILRASIVEEWFMSQTLVAVGASSFEYGLLS
jgi:hypothetical protein